MGIELCVIPTIGGDFEALQRPVQIRLPLRLT